MKDYAVRAIAGGGKIRAMAAVTTQLVEQAREKHQTAPVVTAALGRLLTAAALLGLTLKGEDTLAIKVQGDGPIGKLLVDANSAGQVRGYAENTQVYLPLTEQGKLAVGQAVGADGMIYLTKDLGLKELYTGSSQLVSGEIAEDLANYFLSSEQLPSAVSLGVLIDKEEWVQQSGGFLIQLFPGVDEETIELLEKKLQEMPSISNILEKGATPESILQNVLFGLEIEFLDKQELKFQCQCSLEKIKRALVSLGKEEIETILQEQGQIELRCHFCNHSYSFTEKEIKEIFSGE